jgi:voltage-gated potassium channel
MAEKKELKNLGYEIFIGVLSILSIFNLIAGFFLKDPDLTNIFNIMNAIYSIIFMGDFIYRLMTAPSKSGYFFRQFGWADLLASLPFEQTKILRVFRLVRVYRLMRKVGPKTILDTLIKDRAGSALIILLLMGFFVLEFGSFAILRAEQTNPDSNIKTASDAIWYTLVTISTVGYGDRFPTTNWGRIIGAMIIILGVGIFGTFTGYLANLFLSPQKKEETSS